MLKLALAVLALTACGTADPSMPDSTPDTTTTEVAAAHTQHWMPTGNDAPNGCSPAFTDIPAATADCTSVPVERDGCSVACFGTPGAIKVAVGCAGCSAEYAVSFTGP